MVTKLMLYVIIIERINNIWKVDKWITQIDGLALKKLQSI